jgi:DNA-binding CsgD family transcriptional regulator
MLQYLIWLALVISVALAAGGVVLTARLRRIYNHDVFSLLLYYLVFIYTFGFYGIWGQVVIKTFLSDFISPGMLSRFSDLSMLMGMPFLVFGWMMLMQFSASLSGRKISRWFVLWFLLINFIAIIVIGYFITRNTGLAPLTIFKYYFVVLNSLYTIITSLLIFTSKDDSMIHKHDRKVIASFLIIVLIIQSVPLVFYQNNYHIAVIFIFFFFAGNTFLPLFLTYGTIPDIAEAKVKVELSLEDFCKKFEVSPRETDIVREICNGLSNKEISEKLFISLQTVKDHTHRIYIKTNVRSRVQLINLVKDDSQ